MREGPRHRWVCGSTFTQWSVAHLPGPASVMARAGGRVLTRHVEVEELWMKAPEKEKHYFRTTFGKEFHQTSWQIQIFTYH